MSRAAVLTGLGVRLPATVVTNDMLAVELDTSDEWIRSRTGILQRHIIEPGGSTGDLATEAAAEALHSANEGSADIVVLATSTPDRPCPATAPEIASRLGFPGAAAFDIAAVCTGFVYALAATAAMIESGIADRALVIGADTFSTILDPADRATRAVFGDGAGAVVLRAGDRQEPGALLGFDLGSDGTGKDLITVRDGGSQQRSSGAPATGLDSYFRMKGKTVFVEAVRHMTESLQALAKAIRWDLCDVDRFVLHQANARILAAIAAQLEVADERFARNIDRVGNTVAASIPLALHDAVMSGDLTPGHRVLLSGFGGGVTWGSTALEWPQLTL